MTAPTPEQMRALADQHAERASWESIGGGKRWYEKTAGTLRAAADEVYQLRAVIENAPHDVDSCDRMTYYGYRPDLPCTCWKADAL